MRWATISELNDALVNPPIGLPLPASAILAAVPDPQHRRIPDNVGDRDVDHAIAAYAKAVDHGRRMRETLIACVAEHINQVSLYSRDWTTWARAGRHRGDAEPSPDHLATLAAHVLEVRDEAVGELRHIEPAWQNVSVAVARAQGLLPARDQAALVARREWLDAVAALPVRFAEFAEARALAAWCAAPDVVSYSFHTNPVAFTPVESDRHGANLRRVVDALAELAGHDPAPHVATELEEVPCNS